MTFVVYFLWLGLKLHYKHKTNYGIFSFVFVINNNIEYYYFFLFFFILIFIIDITYFNVLNAKNTVNNYFSKIKLYF